MYTMNLVLVAALTLSPYTQSEQSVTTVQPPSVLADSVRITSFDDSVRITGTDTDSVRITAESVRITSGSVRITSGSVRITEDHQDLALVA